MGVKWSIPARVATEMPDWLDRRHRALNIAARECYALRDAARHDDDAQFFHDTGDIYLGRALALTAEWFV